MLQVGPDELTAASSIIVAVFAGIALWLGWRQIQISREVSALEAYDHYHMVCLQYPAFGSGYFDFKNATDEELATYCVFTSFTLMTGERILSLFPNDDLWINAIKDDIRIHRTFIESEDFAPYLKSQGQPILDLIEVVRREKPEESDTRRSRKTRRRSHPGRPKMRRSPSKESQARP